MSKEKTSDEATARSKKRVSEIRVFSIRVIR